MASTVVFDLDKVLLGGEREGVKIEGFDLGNSPREYVEDVVSGKTVIFTTTNGTAALLHAAHHPSSRCAA